MEPKNRAKTINRIDEAGDESFPASDPPAWGPLHSGGPDHAPEPQKNDTGAVGRQKERDEGRAPGPPARK